MTRKQLAKQEAQVRILKALAYLARSASVDELSRHKERCVCELTDLVRSNLPTVSRHLVQLRDAGIVEAEKRGQTIYYWLRTRCVTRFFEGIESVMAVNAKRQRGLLV